MMRTSTKTNQGKRAGMNAVVLVLAVLLTAGVALTGAVAAGSSVGSTMFYYENVSGSTGSYKYLDSILYLTGKNVIDNVNSYEKGTYVNSSVSPNASIDGIVLNKLDAEVMMYVYDEDGTPINSVIGGTVPQGSKVAFKVNLNLPTEKYTAATLKPEYPFVGLKFIGPDGSGESTYLGTVNYGADNLSRWSIRQLDNNLAEGTWTVWAYFVPMNYPGFFATYAPDSYLNGKKFQFTITSSAASLTAMENTAKVGGYVTVTISGKPNDVYYLKPDKKYEVNHGQQNFDYDTNLVTIGKDGKTTITLKALDYGTLTLQLCDKENTNAVEEELELTFTRSKITASADKPSYYMGSDIKINGTNEALYPLYYYIEGTNYPFTRIDESHLKNIKGAKNWEITIKGRYIQDLKLDNAAYTIYISSVNNTDKDIALSPSAVYTAVSVRLNQPAIVLTTSQDVVVQGDKLTIKGVADSADEVQYYIFGTNKFENGTVSAGKSGAFTIEKTISKDAFATGQYYVVIQHPMYDKVYNIAPVVTKKGNIAIARNTTGQAREWDDILFSINDRQSTNAAQALCDAIENEDVDDACIKTSFIVTGEETSIDPIPSQVTKGVPFTVSGSTNKADGEPVIVELLSTAFNAVSKHSATTASFITLTAVPDAQGKWSVTFETNGLNPDDYTVTVITGLISSNPMAIKVIEAPQVTPTTTSTILPTAAPVTTAKPKSPGFGIAVALAGLGAAVLLRKRG